MSGLWWHARIFCLFKRAFFAVCLLSSGCALYGSNLCCFYAPGTAAFFIEGKICIYAFPAWICLCGNCNYNPAVSGQEYLSSGISYRMDLKYENLDKI